MSTCLPLLLRAADATWHSAVEHQLKICLPTCRLHVEMHPEATRLLSIEGLSENLQHLITRAEQAPDQAQTMDAGQELLLALYVSNPSCTILIEYPLEKPLDRLGSPMQALLVAVVTQAIDHVRLTSKYQADRIRQRQLQRELHALQQQLRTSTHETTTLLEQLRRQDSDYVAALEREVARQTAQLQEANTRLKVANTAKSQFLTLMSHELRTPLNGILGMSDLLLHSPLEKEQREFIEAIRNAGEALFTHVKNLLDFSQIEARQFAINCVEFDLRRTLEEALDTFAASAEGKGLDFFEIVHAHVPEWVRGDPERVCHVLSCLLDNAIKFTATGEIIVKITCAGQTPQEACLHIEVTDTGIGIAPEDQAHLFEPFTQIDRSNTRHHSGMGLGLALTYQFVTQMGGTMGVTSTPGQGSTFWIILRLQRSPLPSHTSSPFSHSVSQHKPTLLLISAMESREQRYNLRQLIRCGYRVDVIDPACDDVNGIIAAAYDGIIFECHALGMDTCPVAAAIREYEVDSGRHIPTIALTTEACGSGGGPCPMADAAACVHQPIVFSELQSALAAWVPLC